MAKLLHPTDIPVVKSIIASIPNTTLKQQVEALFAGVLPAPSEAEVKAAAPEVPKAVKAPTKPVEAPKAVPATPVAAAPVKAPVEAPQPVVEPSKATVEPSKATVEPSKATVVVAPLTISKPLSKEEIRQIKKAAVNAGVLTQLAADQAFGD